MWTSASRGFFSYSANRGENRGVLTKIAMTILAASLAATLVIPVTAMAEGECQQDRQKFCSTETKATVGACLDQHMAKLSEACKAMRQARALASPETAETSPKPPNAQSSSNPPSTEAKPGQAKADASTTNPESRPEAVEAGTKETPAQAGAQILINIDK